jgi:formylglycine-generating enzyme required for sulfatase activity
MKQIRRLHFLGLAAIVLLLCSLPAVAQRTALGDAVVYFGFVVDITVTDPGAGYVTEPAVSITGGGGSGATAVALITNGGVSDIIVLNAGFGYTNKPTVEISSPPQSVKLGLRLAPLLTVEGEPYSLATIQWADALGNTNQWFTITNVMLGSNAYQWCDTEAGTAGKRFYRAIAFPTPTNPDSTQLVWIAPGTFLMGSPDTEVGRSPNEGPQTEVRLPRGFFMRKYETTQGEYMALLHHNPSYYTGNTNMPVEQVSWNDATNFCAHLTASEQAAGRLPSGWAYRLPTEAEWEYACRAGTTNRFSFGDDPANSLWPQYAWLNSNGGHIGHPVGEKLPNPWGLYDMHGHAWEWCLDWQGDYPGGSRIDQQGAVWGPLHATRGGSWENGPWEARSAYRRAQNPEFIYWNVGFRPVLAPLP